MLRPEKCAAPFSPRQSGDVFYAPRDESYDARAGGQEGGVHGRHVAALLENLSHENSINHHPAYCLVAHLWFDFPVSRRNEKRSGQT